MIPGIIAAQLSQSISAAEFSLNADFINEVYLVNGASVPANEVVGSPELIGAQGLDMSDGASVSIIGTFLERIVDARFTMVVEFELLVVASGSTQIFWAQNSGGAHFIFLQSYPDQWTASDFNGSTTRYSEELTPDPTIGIHRIALTRNNAHLAMSVDGDAVIADTTPMSFFEGFELALANFGNSVNGLYVRTCDIMDVVDDAELPGLSALTGFSSGDGHAAGSGVAIGQAEASLAAAGAAAGTGIALAVGQGVGATTPLDGLSNITGAWSFSRGLLTSFGAGTRYTVSGSAIITLEDQSGNNRDLTDGGNSARRPTLITSSGQSCARFNDGVTTNWLTGAAISTFITNATGYVIVSCLFNSLTTNNGLRYQNHPVFGDSGVFMGLHAKSTGLVAAYNWDGNEDGADSGASAVTTATAYVLEWWHTGGQINLRINGGTTFSAASGNTSTMTGTFILGSGGYPVVLIGNIFECAVFNAIPSLAERDALVADFKTWLGI